MSNPFTVLRLAPEASLDDAVKQAARLSQLAADEPARNAVRQAIQQLTAGPEAWALWRLLAHPRPGYQDAAIDRFVAAHRRAPAAEATTPIPGVDRAELRERLLDAIADERGEEKLTLERIEVRESGEEVARQTSEAVWQELVVGMGG